MILTRIKPIVWPVFVVVGFFILGVLLTAPEELGCEDGSLGYSNCELFGLEVSHIKTIQAWALVGAFR